MNHVLSKALLLISLTVLSACGVTGNKPGKALLLQDHPLVNRIWDVQAGRFIERQQLNQRILSSDYLLLGETHDNIRHHQLQASVIDTLRQSRRDASVAFEMIDDEQGELLKGKTLTSSAQLVGLLRQVESTWPYETQYRVVFDSVLAAGYAILPANLNRSRLRQMMKLPEKELPPEIGRVLRQVALSKEQLQLLQADIVKGHCGMIPLHATGSLVLAQRIRDAVMSQSLLRSKHKTRVLIAGSGHVRNDRGVPLYLRKLERGAAILAIGLREVDAGAMSIDDYLDNEQTMPFDYVWFTPAVEREDPCLRFKMKR